MARVIELAQPDERKQQVVVGIADGYHFVCDGIGSSEDAESASVERCFEDHKIAVVDQHSAERSVRSVRVGYLLKLVGFAPRCGGRAIDTRREVDRERGWITDHSGGVEVKERYGDRERKGHLSTRIDRRHGLDADAETFDGCVDVGEGLIYTVEQQNATTQACGWVAVFHLYGDGSTVVQIELSYVEERSRACTQRAHGTFDRSSINGAGTVYEGSERDRAVPGKYDVVGQRLGRARRDQRSFEYRKKAWRRRRSAVHTAHVYSAIVAIRDYDNLPQRIDLWGTDVEERVCGGVALCQGAPAAEEQGLPFKGGKVCAPFE